MPKPVSYQPISVESVLRSTIREHPRNPRRINDASLAALERGLAEFGMLEPVLVNRATGHVLSGHQRLRWLDKKHRGDYQVQVSFAEVPRNRELELIVLLNNERAMGEWDLPALHDVLTGDFDIDLAGFDTVQVEMLFPDDPELSNLFAEAPELVNRTVEMLKGIREGRKHPSRIGAGSELDTETYIVVVFPDRDFKEEFLRARGINWQERYISWDRLFGQQVESGMLKSPSRPRRNGAGRSNGRVSRRSQQKGPTAK
jgi:hypothetical protein